MSLEGVKTVFEIGYYVVAICAAIAAVIVYYQNRRLEQSRWASTFYEKFYEGDKYRTYVFCWTPPIRRISTSWSTKSQ
jgi:tryptophan-rich sensory protein